MEISDKHKAFAEAYLTNGFNVSQAYMVVYPNSKRESSLSNANRLMENEGVKKYIQQKQQELSEKFEVTREDILKILLKIANDSEARNADKINASSVIAKIGGFITNRIDITSKGKGMNLSDMLGFNEANTEE